MTNEQSALKSNVHLMGELLGNTIKAHLGEDFLDQIEQIRHLSKSAREGNEADYARLVNLLKNLDDSQLVPVTRAFTQFLNLANIAEQFHTVSRQCEQNVCVPDTLSDLLVRLKAGQFTPEQVRDSVAVMTIELVFTAHPTEVTRRTVIQKHSGITECLTRMEHSDLLTRERERLINRIEQLVSQIWHTEEIRNHRPTPVDEAKWGYATVEHSLWHALPGFLRQLDERLYQHTGYYLPLDAMPVRFASWMGGDRDGNPNVTAAVTREVLLLSRWTAAEMFLRDLQPLISELSMAECSPDLRYQTRGSHEPYRQVLKELREGLKATRHYCEQKLAGRDVSNGGVLECDNSLITPLQRCYDSLCAVGLSVIARGPLLDTLRRARCFGLGLVRLDIRQEAGRHLEVLSELTCYLGLGDYAQWTEQERQAFLLTELDNRRPLIPMDWQPSGNVQEVLDTCRVIAAQQQERMGAYIVSMAREPSDVLSVILLLRETGCRFNMPIAPLFETLSDLEYAETAMRTLLSLPWYRGYAGNRQMVMIGYSDSAKDAGQMAAAWAQYRAMEGLTAICKEAGIGLTLFHGRGGTVGRGGGPAHAAILSQPPGSVAGYLRVTEQGEMIRFKFGFPAIAVQSLSLYASATLEATLLPPPAPEPAWRQLMDQMAQDSLATYRGIVCEEPDFVPYFRTVTPEQELNKLPLGSRPAKRCPEGGVESLRAIPWIFAWAQCRLMLPAWLGSGVALRRAIESGHKTVLAEMIRQWPFFRARLELLEMVYLKSDAEIAKYYEERLVPENLRHLGRKLRQLLADAVAVMVELKDGHPFLEQDPWVRQAIELRNPYSDPLHVLQAELLFRDRHQADSVNPAVERALMLTITGIAAGMRNTG